MKSNVTKALSRPVTANRVHEPCLVLRTVNLSRRCRVASILLASVFLVLSGCAALPERAAVADIEAAWQARTTRLAGFTEWALTGRAALTTPDEGWQVTLRWAHKGARETIDLAGPFGSGRVRLTQDKSGAQLRDSQNRVYRAANAQQVLERATGWQLPIAGLHYWIRGLPAPGPDAARELDDYGRLKALRQFGWEIQFLEYRVVGAYELPSKLSLTHRLAANATRNSPPEEASVVVRMVIANWELAGGS